ncbi:MAG: phosphate ABC transporter permease PstA [Alphaproteobacteria bacterium]|nr:phosphate ABC transporter permease PstA [Alphaproteobacteria bacterium]
MTDARNGDDFATIHTRPAARKRLARRYRAERRFRFFGAAAIFLSVGFLALLLGSIVLKALPAFTHNFAALEFDLSAPLEASDPATADYDAIVRNALRDRFPEVAGRTLRRELSALLSSAAPVYLARQFQARPAGTGFTVPLSDTADLYLKGLLARSRTIVATGPAKWTTSGERGALETVTAPDLRAIENAFTGQGGQDGQRPSILIEIAGGVLKIGQLDANIPGGVWLARPRETGNAAEPGQWRIRIFDTPQAKRKLSDRQIVWLDRLVANGTVRPALNTIFFTRGASREPEMAGIWGAVVGSALALVVTLALAFPLGVGAAIYMHEFARPGRWSRFVEVNINNLAAVPSIIFGLLGLAVLLNVFGLHRSAPYVGGIVLALMTLPTIIIAARVALGAVPGSIRQAALAVGASPLQTVFHHVLPRAMPAIMTGTIIGMARALGETAPLLMIGMVAFIVDIPGGFADPATVLPVQIFMWADFPEAAFGYRSAAAILVLLVFLLAMNGAALLVRARFERARS